MNEDQSPEVLIEGKRYQLIPYGDETIDGGDVFARPCHVCGAEPDSRHSRRCSVGRGALYQRPVMCRDCGVPVGYHHVGGCGIEQCPRCGDQYMSCECDSSEDNEE